MIMADMKGPNHIVDTLRSSLRKSLAALAFFCIIFTQISGLFLSCVVGFIILMLAFISFLLWDMIRMKPARTFTLVTVFQKYLYVVIMYYFSKWVLEKRYEPCMKNLKAQQTEYLLKLLNRYKDTEYGKEHKFSQVQSIEDFQRIHPLTKYDHMKPYIDRTIDGEENVLFTEKLVYVAMTSGTTGANKRIAITSREAQKCMYHYMVVMPPHMRKQYWRTQTLRKMMMTRMHVPYRATDLGVQMGPFSYMARFRMPELDYDAIPLECWDIVHDEDNLYVHVLFALINRDTELFFSAFPSAYQTFFATLEQNLDQICDDIRNGSVSDKINLDYSIRQSLNEKLTPWPERADEVKKICDEGSHRLVQRLWPEANHVMMIQDGPFRPLAMSLLEKQFHGIPSSCFAHASSEANVGIFIPYGLYGNTFEDEHVFSINPSECFFEFIHVDELDDEEPKTKCLYELKVGEGYEILISNYRGFYRYRTGDLIKIIGHNGEIPLYTFSQRRGDVLNLTFEKTPQVIIEKLLEKAAEKLEITIVDSVSTEILSFEKSENRNKKYLGDTSGPGFYVMFIEVDGDAALDSDISESFDQILCEIFENYAGLRKRNKIGQMKVIRVKEGTFSELTTKMVAANKHTSLIQFKMPKVQRQLDYLEFLLDHMEIDE